MGGMTHTQRPKRDPSRPLRTDHDLLEHARFISQGVASPRRQLWLTMIDSYDVPLPVLIPIEDIDAAPDDVFVKNVFQVISTFLPDAGGGGSVTFLLERLGSETISVDDCAWDAALRAHGQAVGVPVRAVFLSVRGVVRLLTADDAAAAS